MVELYLYSPSRPSRPVKGELLTLRRPTGECCKGIIIAVYPYLTKGINIFYRPNKESFCC
jgi:hypothetical protein